MPTEKAIIIGFNDTDDGEDAYISALTGVDYTDFASVLVTALRLLAKNDHVCITDVETYDRLGETGYKSYLPYSIDINCGQFVKKPSPEIVNNL